MRYAAVICAVLLALLGAAPARALDVSAGIEPRQGTVGEQILLTVVISGGGRDAERPQLPDLTQDFDVRSAGTSRNFSIVNGRTSSSVTYRYVLVPRREGTFMIPPIEVRDGSTVARTAPIRVVVAAAQAPPSTPPDRGEEGAVTVGSRDVFVRASVDNRSPFVFEQVTFRLKFYNRVRLLDAPRLSGVTTEGFWREDLPGGKPTTTTIDGELYQVWEVAYALFATAPGELTIRDALFECDVQVRRANRDPFSVFGGSLYDGKRVQVRADPITLDVKPLPAGAPPGFDGAVGDYVLETTVDKTTVEQNAPVTLTVKVSGNGNLRTLGDVGLPKLSDFRSYPQGSSQDMGPRGETIGGSQTQQFVLVPLSAGRKTVPPVELVTFSPRAGEYRVLRSRPIALDVQPGTGPAPLAGGARGDIEVVGRDIRFIETELPGFVPLGSGLQGALTWIYLMPVPLLAYVGVFFWERRRRRLGSDVALRRRSTAARIARRRLRAAGKQESPGERAAAAAEALRGYCADRWNLAAAGITPDLIREHAGRAGVEAEELLALLDRLDAVRFAPGLAAGSGDPLEESGRCLDTLEKQR